MGKKEEFWLNKFWGYYSNLADENEPKRTELAVKKLISKMLKGD